MEVGKLNGRKVIGSLDTGLGYSLIAILICAALAFSFVFILNWEDWFFGIKLDGLSAGLYLITKAIIAIVLAVLLIRLPKYQTLGTLLVIAFLGFLFFDSAATIQKNSAGRESFSLILAISLLISVTYLIVHFFSTRMKSRKKPDVADTATETVVPLGGREKSHSLNPIVFVAGGIVVLAFVVFILIPIVFSLIAPYIPFTANLGAPPAHDTLITKIDPDGKTGWQSTFPGYSLDPVRVATPPDCAYILYGTYWVSGKPGPVARVLNLDCNGTIAFDFTRVLDRSPGITGVIQSVNVFADGYLIHLDNGNIIHLDKLGNFLNEEPGTGREIAQVSDGSPVGYYPSALPAPGVSVKVRLQGQQGTVFTISDTLHHREIQSIYSVNPTHDGGYLVSAST